MANWLVSFATRNEDVIDISIAGKSGDVNEKLIPSDAPFMTQEEGNEDLFVPIKTQSGYINVVSDNIGFVRSIIPISGGTRSVTVMRNDGQGSYLVWKGYVEPKMLSYRLWQGKLTVNIPVECPLSALRYKVYHGTSATITIAKLLYDILPDFTYYVFQGAFIGSNGDSAYTNYSWLAKRIYTQLFRDKNYTHLQVLEKICTFFGWTCRSMDNTVYFLMNRNVDAITPRTLYKVTRSELPKAIPTAVTADPPVWIEKSLLPNSFADTKSELVIFEGIKQSTVNCSLSTFNMQITLPDDQIKQDIGDGTWQLPVKHDTTTQGVGYDTYYYDNFGPTTVGDWVVQTENVGISVNRNDSMDVQDWEYIFDVRSTIKTDMEVPPTSSEDQPWYIPLTYYDSKLKLTTSNEIEFQLPGTLELIFDQAKNYNNNNKGLYFYFKIGNFFYIPDTGEWDTSAGGPCWSNDGKYTVNIPANLPSLQAPVKGVISIEIIDTGKLGGFFTPPFALSGLSMEYKTIEYEDVDSNINNVTHYAETAVEFSQTADFESDLCLKETFVSNSQNIVLNNDGTNSTGLVDQPSQYATEFNPLKRLVTEAANEGKRLGEMLKYNIFAEWIYQGVNPLTIIEVEEFGDVFYPSSISRDWRNDIYQLKMIKRIYSEDPLT